MFFAFNRACMYAIVNLLNAKRFVILLPILRFVILLSIADFCPVLDFEVSRCVAPDAGFYSTLRVGRS